MPATKLVLVADDDPAVCTLVRRLLQRNGFASEGVSSGSEALAKLSSTRYDAVILDLMMHDGSGFDVLAHLEQATARIPCVVISAASQKTLDRAAQSSIVRGVLRKPFDIEQLMLEVRSCMD
jgi:CheY-like chemotaxis protein